MWTCVESRDGQFGQMIRKIVFGDIYENEDYARQRIPIPKNIELKVKLFNAKRLGLNYLFVVSEN